MSKEYAKISQHQRETFVGSRRELFEARKAEIKYGGVGSKRKAKEFLITGKIRKR